MIEEQLLDKTNRINMLFDFYGRLLTDKQRTFLSYYFHEDFSLGEIAADFEISRQAVYEHIKRAESTLEELELKLQLLAKHEERGRIVIRIEQLLTETSNESHNDLKNLIQQLYNID
jgi:predicted DNA-binding protein YlxM (UPF0122 family)